MQSRVHKKRKIKAPSVAKEQPVERTEFYKKNWFMWVMLIVAWPIGLFLLWKYSSYDMTGKMIITLVFTGLNIGQYLFLQ